MLSRSILALIVAFFLVMNFLLWRSEIAGRNNVRSTIPAEIVWKKILTAPDISSLEIQQGGQKLGSIRWIPSVGEELRSGRVLTEEAPPEGMIKGFSSYTLELDGHIMVEELERVRFNFGLTLGTNYAWQEFNLRLILRPNIVEIQSIATNHTLQLTMIDGTQRTERVFTFEELRNPQKLLRELAGPWLPAELLAMALPFGVNSAPTPASLGLEWTARSDTLQFGSARIRGYRLNASVLDRFHASLFVNTLGEIIRLDLPNQIVIINDGLTSL